MESEETLQKRLEEATKNHEAFIKEHGGHINEADRLRNLAQKADEEVGVFNQGFKKKLSKNKKLAWGIGLGTAALGSLGAYGYYRNKNKKKK